MAGANQLGLMHLISAAHRQHDVCVRCLGLGTQPKRWPVQVDWTGVDASLDHLLGGLLVEGWFQETGVLIPRGGRVGPKR